jgi:hypothetical protein
MGLLLLRRRLMTKILPTKFESKNVEEKNSKYQNAKTLGIRNNLREKIEKDV